MKLVRESLNEARSFPVLTPGWSKLSPVAVDYFADLLQDFITERGKIGKDGLLDVMKIMDRAGLNSEEIMQRGDSKYDVALKLLSAVRKERK